MADKKEAPKKRKITKKRKPVKKPSGNPFAKEPY